MPIVDLERFQTNCRLKAQQVQLLQSMRTTRDDRFMHYLANLVQPWDHWQDPGAWHQRRQIQNGRSDWLINQHLLELRRNCP